MSFGRARSSLRRMLLDRCIILRADLNPVPDAYGKQRTTYIPDAEPIPCSFVIGSARSASETWTRVPGADTHIFLPLETAIRNIDRIQLVARAGLPISPQTFQAEGQPQQDAVVLKLQLKAIVETP